MTWRLLLCEDFLKDLAKAPKNVQNAFHKTARPKLRDSPKNHRDTNIKKLAKFKDLWRIKLAREYRLIYAVHNTDQKVTMVAVGHRKDIYSRLGYDPNSGAPGIEVIADDALHDFLEEKPTPIEQGRAICELPQRSNSDSMHLVNKQFLEDQGIPEEYHSTILECSSEDELLSLEEKGIPKSVLESLIEALHPSKKSIRRLIEPVRVLPDETDFKMILEGRKSITDLLLDLDESQTAFVRRFSREELRGPWLLKGGPGSGKSTVALYCIENLVRTQGNRLQEIAGGGHKILFSTYTNSLSRVSTVLLKSLGVGIDENVTVSTTDKLVQEYVDTLPRRVDQRQAENLLGELLNGTSLALSSEFLLEEFEWCLAGEDITSLESYLDHDRIGRVKPLNSDLREKVWEVYTRFIKKLQNLNLCLFSYPFQVALGNGVNGPRFDFVFIDEAQDLKPIALRFLVALAKEPTNVFLAADKNQSIYGSGFSWRRISEGQLDFRGRTRILKKNHRSTLEIWDAVAPLLEGQREVDLETMDTPPYRSGSPPTLGKSGRQGACQEVISKWVKDERFLPSTVAVLCYTNSMCKAVARSLPKNLNAKYMRSKDVDISYPGVKVLTMHASKGLQFPVVIVAGLNGHHFNPNTDDDSRKRHLLFVACTRAMNRLLLLEDISDPSPFLKDLPMDKWEDLDDY